MKNLTIKKSELTELNTTELTVLEGGFEPNGRTAGSNGTCTPDGTIKVPGVDPYSPAGDIY